MSNTRKKYKKRSSSNKTPNNCSNNKDEQNTSKLCSFSAVDYIVLASTLAIALGEELSSDDINILASFFAVLSDELALIAAIDVCGSRDDNSSTFVSPVPDVAATSLKNKKK